VYASLNSMQMPTNLPTVSVSGISAGAVPPVRLKVKMPPPPAS
jgi:hypothetical protein